MTAIIFELFQRVLLNNPTPGLTGDMAFLAPRTVLTSYERTVQDKALSYEFGQVVSVREDFIEVTFENGKGTHWMPKSMFSIATSQPKKED